MRVRAVWRRGMGAWVATRSEAQIEGEIEEIRRAAAADGRSLTTAEHERVNELIVERAAAFRAWDQQWRAGYVRQQEAFWHARDRARLRGLVRPSPLFLGLLAACVASGVYLATSPAYGNVRVATIVFIISGWVASVCVHEFGHALAGYLGGDRSVAERGYLTLDPRRYTNPLLSIALPVLFLLMGGIGLPGGAVLIHRERLRSRNWDLAVSAGGPLGTLLCLLLFAVPYLLLGTHWVSDGNVYFWAALAALIKLEVISLILNLLPIPPLDGFKIFSHWLPDHVRAQGNALGFMPLMLLYVALGGHNAFSDAFWNLAARVDVLLRVPDAYAIYALQLLSLR